MSLDEIETQIAAPLSAALIAVAAISLPLIKAVDNPEMSLLDELFAIIGIAALIGAGRIIDREFDKAGLKIQQRVFAFGGGYIVFCAVVGLIASAILLLDTDRNKTTSLCWATPLALLTGGSIFFLLMTEKGQKVWMTLAIVAASIFFVAPHLIHPTTVIVSPSMRFCPAPLADCA